VAKFLNIIPRRCKGRPHVFGFFDKDPVEYRAVATLLLNDQPGGFVDGTTRFPVRFFYTGVKWLRADEVRLIKLRVMQFVHKWMSLKEVKPPADPSLKELFNHDTLDYDALFTFLSNPPKEFLPECKFA
jgi:hypothetical protein